MGCPDPLYDYDDFIGYEEEAYNGWEEVNESYEWDPIMGDSEDWIDTDDMWLDDFQGEEEFA